MIDLKNMGKFLEITGDRENAYYTEKKSGKTINWNIDSTMGVPLLSCNRMNNETLDFIINLPETILIKFVNLGTYYENTKNITYIETEVEVLPTPIYLKHKMPLTKEEKDLLARENCTTILTEHTHIINNESYGDYVVYNQESVGLTSGGIQGDSHGELKLVFKNGHWDFNINHIEYNYDEIKQKIDDNPLLFEKCKNWGTDLIAAIDSGINVPVMYMFEKNRIVKEIAQ